MQQKLITGWLFDIFFVVAMTISKDLPNMDLRSISC